MPEGDTGGIPDPTDPLTGANLGYESSLSNWAGDYVTNMLGQGWALGEQPYDAYTGPLTAPISSLQDQAFQSAAGMSVPEGLQDAADMALGAGEAAGELSYDPMMFTSGYNASPYYSTFDPTNFANTFESTNYQSMFNPTQYNMDYQPGQFDSGFDAAQYLSQYSPTDYNVDYQPGQFDSGYESSQFDPNFLATLFQSQYDPTNFQSQYESSNFDPNYTDKGKEFFQTAYEAGLFDDINFDPTDFAGQVGRWTDEGVAESYMNPFMEQVLDPQLEEIRRQAEITRLNDASRLTQAGAFGGSRQAIMESEGWDNMARLMNETEGAAYRDAYNTGSDIWKSDEDRMLEAMGLGDRSRQFGANLDLQSQQAAEQAKQFAAGQEFDAAMAADKSSQFGSSQSLEAQRLGDLSQQFGSSQNLEAQRLSDLASQFADNQQLRAGELSDSSNRFASQQDLEAQRLGDVSRQYDAARQLEAQGMTDSAQRFLSQQEIESQRLGDLSRQFGDTQQLEATRLGDMSNQFAAEQMLKEQGMSDDAARYYATQMMESQRLGDLSSQFADTQQMEASRLGDLSNQYESGQDMEAQRLSDASQQFASAQDMEASRYYDLARQFQDSQYMDAQRLTDQSNQFAADFGSDLLRTQLDASRTAGDLYGQQTDTAMDILNQQKLFGDSERDIYQQGIAADYNQWMQEQMYPYKQVQFMQSLLQDLPLKAQEEYLQQADPLSLFGGSLGGIMEIYNQIFGADGTGTNPDASTNPVYTDTQDGIQA